ncbi:MAG: hypothetical protein HGA37_00735 [Lentimicrobium sp.]|nr:hypothetical protein [Lentimicrobium sp.]
MKDTLLAILSRLKRPIDGKLRNRFSVFLVCVAMSTLMWGMIKLTREYEAPVKFTIVPENLPDGKILVDNPDSVITLTLSAKGLDLYSRIIFNKENLLTISLAKIKLQRQEEDYSGILKTSGLIKVIAQQLPPGAKLISIEPDTLHFTFQKSFRKKIPVHPKLKLSFIRQYQLYDSLKLRPDSVWVSGVREIVDTIGFIDTERKVINSLSSNYSTRLSLETPQTRPGVKLSSDSVTITINVEKFTEADIEVPVSLSSGDKALSYRTFPDKVTLTCRVAMRDYKRLDPSLFTASVDYESARKSGSNRVPVEIKHKPSFTRVVRISPEKVEFLILK